MISDPKWELYHVAEDFSEAINLADKRPDKLRELQLLFYAEAAKYGVLPLDDRGMERLDPASRPSLTRGRSEFTYYGIVTRIPEAAAPDVKNKSYRIAANVVLPTGSERGVVVTHGGLSGGYALLFENGRPVFRYNLANVAHYRVAALDPLRPGKHSVVVDFAYDGGGVGKGGTATLSVDGQEVAKGRIERTTPFRYSLDETFDVGADTGTPVNLDYDVPFTFTGVIEKVQVKLGEAGLGAADRQRLQDMEQQAMATQ